MIRFIPLPSHARAACTAMAVLGSVACSPKYYAPNTHNVPLLERAGDVSASFAAGDGRAELAGAYAFADDVSLMVSAAYFGPDDDPDGDGGEGGLAELGVGLQREVWPRMRLEVYGLVGAGDLENHFPSTLANNPSSNGIIEGRLLRYGVQPALGLRTRYLHLAASARFMRLHYANIRGSLVFGGEDQVQYLRGADSHTLLEPAVTLRAGLESVKVQLQLGRSFNLSRPDFRQDKGHVTVGVVYMPVRSRSD